VGVHVIARLPAPTRRDVHPRDVTATAAASRVLHRRFDEELYARVQADVARMYGLSADDFEHVLGTFPLVDAAIREASLRLFLAASPDDR
jgi:hypothetical protein